MWPDLPNRLLLIEADAFISHMLYRGSWPGERYDVERLIARLRAASQDSEGDPAEVHPPDSLAESQAGLNDPGGSPTSPSERDPDKWIEAEGDKPKVERTHQYFSALRAGLKTAEELSYELQRQAEAANDPVLNDVTRLVAQIALCDEFRAAIANDETFGIDDIEAKREALVQALAKLDVPF